MKRLIMMMFLTVSSQTACSAEAPLDDTIDLATAEEALRSKGDCKPSIVLVHGAFADGTGWQKVIPLLERKGYFVTAVQNPLTSLEEDIATTKRVIEAVTATGPAIVVGHSYGGAVITGAVTGNSQVKALVYVNAWVPESGEPLGVLLDTFGPGPLNDALRPDSAGFLYIARDKFRELFCADVKAVDAQVMAAVQKPISYGVLEESVPDAAWDTIPSWYLLGEDDFTIPPILQRYMAERAGSEITEIESSHASLVSHPDAVVKLIESAARATRD